MAEDITSSPLEGWVPTEEEAQKLQELIQIRRDAGERFEGEDIDTLDAFLGKIMNFSNSIKKKYPDSWSSIRLYHVLGGSTVPEGDPRIKSFDTPEGEIESFIRSLDVA